MNKFIKKPFGKQSKKLSPQVVSKVENNPAKKKDGGFSKKGLETRIFAQTLRGVALLTVDEVKALQISLDSKGHGSLTIDDVLFTCEEVSIADQQKAYVFKRTIDHGSMQNAALISAEQASKIGLKEGIDQIKVGDTYYKVHYVDYADFPKKFKQDNQIVNPHLAPLSSQDEKNENSAAELSQFFQNLREKERKLTPTKKEETTPSDDQTITVSNLKQSLIPQGIKDKKIYDLTNLQDKEDLSKKVVDQSLDTDLQRETELALARTTLTSQGDFEVDFAYKHSWKTVNDFWTKLFNFYNVDPSQWEKRSQHLKADGSINPIYDLEQEQLNKLLSAKNSVGLLLNQQMQMTNEENELQQKISALQLILEENKINPETNQEYLDLTLAHNEIKRKLTEIESRLAYLKSHPESQEYQKNKRHFVEVIGFSDVISKNRDLVVKKSLTLDTDLNEIEAQKVVLERLLQKKIGLLNQAKKEKAKLEKQKLELIAQNTEINDADVLLANHLTSLAERGRIHEKNTLIQARINLERNRLTNSIANLAEFKTYSDYQAEIQKLEASDLKLSQRKEKLDEMLINAQYKLLHEQKIIKEECENSKKFFLELEQIILTLISGFEHQAIFGLENVRKIWNEKAVHKLNSIYNKNNNLLTQVSNVVLSQIERLSIEQKRLTKVLEQQQENWVKLFEEATQQFRLQGLYIPPSQVSKIISHNQFSLANQPVGEPAMKVMELRYNPEYLVDNNLVSYSLKKNSLIGLDPITKDDDQYVSADLAEQSAKPLQDDLSRQEVIQKEVDQEKEYIDRVEDQIIQGQIQKQEDQMEEKNIKSMLKIEETEALMLSRYLKSIKSDTVASFQGKLLYHADQILEKKNTWFENNQIQIETQFDVEPILPVAKQDARDELELIGEYDYATEDAILLEQQIIGEDQEISESELEFDLLQQQNLAKISNETRDTIPDLAGRPITFNDEQVFTPNPDFTSKSPYGPKNLSEVDRWSRREFETALSNEQKLLTAAPSQNEIRENQMAIDKINQKFETELMKAREDLEHSGEKISSLLKEE